MGKFEEEIQEAIHGPLIEKYGTGRRGIIVPAGSSCAWEKRNSGPFQLRNGSLAKSARNKTAFTLGINSIFSSCTEKGADRAWFTGIAEAAEVDAS